MWKTPKKILWTKIITGMIATVFLIQRGNISEIFTIPYVYADHDCSWWDVFCHIDNWWTHNVWDFIVNFALSYVFTLAWIIIALLWLPLIVIPRLVYWILYELIVGISSLCIMLSTKLIESAVYPGEAIAQGLLYNPRVLDAIYLTLWLPVRDLVHVGFALLLITGAIITIVKADKEIISQYGSKFMLAIILVNFSWFIPRVVLDIANVTAAASFSFARCTDCYTIDEVYFFTPPLTCTEAQTGPNSRRVCPTLLIAVNEKKILPGDNPARKAMGALLDPFMEILNLRVLPRIGGGWVRLSKLFVIYNVMPNPLPPAPPNPPVAGTFYAEPPGYPSGWIGIGNLFKCIWFTCNPTTNPPTPPTDPISGRINTIGPFLSAVANFFIGAMLGSFRMIILIFLSAIFLVLYVFALVALMAMVLLRIPIIWLTIGFMPVVALAFVLGRGGAISGFLWTVWEKFIGAAFIPAAIGIPIAAGSAILNTARTIGGNPIAATGIVADLFGLDGIIQIMFIIIAIIVIWLGVFAAINTLNFAGSAQSALAGSIKTIGQGAAAATGYKLASSMPILPLGAAWKGLKFGTLAGVRSTTAAGKLASIVGKGGGQTIGRTGAELGKGAWWLAKKVPLVEAGTKKIGKLGKYVGGKAADLGGYVGGKAADLGGYVGGKAADLGGYVGGKARNMGNWIADATQKLKGKLPLAGISNAAGKTREKLAYVLGPLLTEGKKLPQIFQPTTAETKMVGWAGAASKFLGEKALPGIASVAGSVREKIGSIFSGSALQQMLVGGLMKAGTGQLNTVLGDYARGGGQRSLGELLSQRLGVDKIDKNSAKKAAEKLGKDPNGKGDMFLKAAEKLLANPADAASRKNLLEVLEALKKDGVTIDTSGGLGSIARAIIDEGQADTANPLHSKFDKINGLDLELRMNAADKAAASGSPTPTPTTTPIPSGGPAPTSTPPSPSTPKEVALNLKTSERNQIQFDVDGALKATATDGTFPTFVNQLIQKLQEKGLEVNNPHDLTQHLEEIDKEYKQAQLAKGIPAPQGIGNVAFLKSKLAFTLGDASHADNDAVKKLFTP